MEGIFLNSTRSDSPPRIRVRRVSRSRVTVNYCYADKHNGNYLNDTYREVAEFAVTHVLVNGRPARVTAIFTPGSKARLDPSVTGESTPASAPLVPVGQVSPPLLETGEVSESVTVRTGNGAGSLTIGKGVVARDGDGNLPGEVTIERADAAGLPPIPPGTTIRATFDPPTTLTYTLSGEER